MLTLKENEKIGRYSVNHLIKQSVFNGTYKVSDDEGKAYFMKFFEVGKVPEKMLQDGVVREIVQSRDIRHENVISYVDDGETDRDGAKYQYLICDFLRGKLLSEFLESEGCFPVDVAKNVLLGILEGLRYLLGKDLLHNDICPRNIILEESGKDNYIPRIIDLGHLGGYVHGTPTFPVEDLNLLYSAPETLSGFFEWNSDVFSAAALLYTMIAGKAPWDCELGSSESYADRKRKVRNARREELDTAVLREKGAAEDLVNLIVRGLDITSKRCSMEEFYDALTGKAAVEKPKSDGGHPHKTEEGKRDGGQEEEGHTTAKVQIKKRSGGGFADVAGMDNLKDELTKRVIWILRDKEKAEKYRLMPPNGMVLYGPPGCGKTYFAEKFAEESGFNFSLVNGSDLGSVYIHGTQGKIADLFKKAEQNAPTILCFDEFDSFVPSRGSEAAQHRPEEVNEFLGQLNNCAKKGVFVIGTTNRLDLIDPAVLRKGRMDLHIEIPAPDAATRKLMFEHHLKGRPLADDIDTDALAAMTDNYAASDIALIVNEASMMAALADELVSQSHIVNSVKSNRSSLGKRDDRPRIGFK